MRYIAYSVLSGDLARVAVNQSGLEKAERDAKSYSVRNCESWLYAADKGQILVGHYVNGKPQKLTAPEVK